LRRYALQENKAGCGKTEMHVEEKTTAGDQDTSVTPLVSCAGKASVGWPVEGRGVPSPCKTNAEKKSRGELDQADFDTTERKATEPKKRKTGFSTIGGGEKKTGIPTKKNKGRRERSGELTKLIDRKKNHSPGDRQEAFRGRVNIVGGQMVLTLSF